MENVVRIRSNLNSSTEFSVKSKGSRIITIKIERSKGRGSQEFINEISEEEYKALKSEKIFKTLIADGDLQIIREDTAEEKDGSKAFSMEELEAYATSELKSYKEGGGAELLQSYLEKQKETLELEFTGRLQEALENQNDELRSGFATKIQEDNVLSNAEKEAAANKVKTGLIQRHNKEVESGKLKKW
jgi:hypothetical protein